MHIMDLTIPLNYITIRLTAADYVEISESQYWLTFIVFPPALCAVFPIDLLFV
jgi:hypothetical protein